MVADAAVLVWDSLAQGTAGEETQSHTEMVHKLDALVDDSEPSHKRVLPLRFSEYLTLAYGPRGSASHRLPYRT